jgi:hypothetical protein
MDNAVNTALFISASSVLMRAHPDIIRFFSSNMVIFILVALYVGKTKSTQVAIASGFFAAILATIVTNIDFLSEPFELIYPGPNSSTNCLKLKKADLIKAFKSENELKTAMMESGVPGNIELNDENSPEIATYLANSNSKFTGCSLIV